MSEQKHIFYWAGESDCPKELKASNGELHTLRCRMCGKDDPESTTCEGGKTLPQMYDGLAEENARLQSELTAARAEVERLNRQNQQLLVERNRSVDREQYNEALSEIHRLETTPSQRGEVEPDAWIRFCSDGCYEGPLRKIDEARHKSGAWTPLYATPPAPAAERIEERGAVPDEH